MIGTGWLACVGVRVAEVANIAVVVVLTTTSMSSLVTNWLWVRTIEIVIVASWTAAINSTTASTTEEAVVVIVVTNLIKPGTERTIVTH